MFQRKIRYLLVAILFLLSFVLTGCIPPNEHVGKAAPHSYKDGYYDGYYGGGGYYYR